MEDARIRDIAAKVKQFKRALADGTISREQHDQAVRKLGVDPYTYEYKPDSVQLTGQESGKKLGSSASGASKVKKEKGRTEEPVEPARTTGPGGVQSVGIPMGIEEEQAPPPAKVRLSGLFGPSNIGDFAQFVEFYKSGDGGILGQITGQ